MTKEIHAAESLGFSDSSEFQGVLRPDEGKRIFRGITANALKHKQPFS